MKAVIFKEAGDPGKVLILEEISKPTPGKGEVLVRVLASPINPADFLFIEGRYRVKPEFPQVAGLEGAGIVEEAGSNVPIAKGTLVSFRFKKAWTEYITVPVERLITLPADFPIEKAAQFSLNPITAWALLAEVALKEGDWLLLTAGSSAVSKQLIQLAKKRNIRVIATVRSENHRSELLQLKADAVINTEEKVLSQEVLAITDGKGVNAAFDAVGGDIGTEVLKSVGTKGTIIIYGLLSADPVYYRNADFIQKLITIKGFGIDNWLAGLTGELKKAMVSELVNVLNGPDFLMRVAGKFRLEDFKEALQQSMVSGDKGKTLFWFE